MTISKAAKTKSKQEFEQLNQVPIEVRIELLASLLVECIADEVGSNAT